MAGEGLGTQDATLAAPVAMDAAVDNFWAFDSFSEFLAMGNHGFYVWLAYGITFMVLGLLAWQSFAGHARLRQEIVAQVRRNNLSSGLEAAAGRAADGEASHHQSAGAQQ